MGVLHNNSSVACAMALRESLATHDDASNLILLLNQSRDRRREVRNNLILLFKQQQVAISTLFAHLGDH